MSPRILLTLEPLPSHVPVALRLRQLLKPALRRDRLKCVHVEGDALDEAPTLPIAQDDHKPPAPRP